MNKIKAGLIVAALALGTVVAVAAPASAADYGVNMNVACQLQGQSSAYLASSGAYGWRCSPGNVGVNVQNYCKYTYGSAANAVVLNASDANSWRCRV